MHQYRVAKK